MSPVTSMQIRLTELDRKILGCLPAAEDIDSPGLRATDVAVRVIRPGVAWHRTKTTAAEIQEVQEILNGLECIRLAWNDNGWWRRA